MRRLLADPAEIDRILAAGAERARCLAAPSMAEVPTLGEWGAMLLAAMLGSLALVTLRRLA